MQAVVLQDITDRLRKLPFATPTRPYLILAAAVFLCYCDIYPNTFVLDDIPLLTRNRFLTSWSYLPDIFTHLDYAGAGAVSHGYYRPLAVLPHLIIYQLFGLSTVAFHTLNIFIHALNAGLVYRLGRRLGFIAGAAFTAALLWAVHPLHTEAITYMCDTVEPLFTTFSLLGLLALLPDFAPRKIAVAALYFLLAAGCKQTAIIFPVLAAACLFMTAKDKERLNFRLYLKTWPLWLLAAAYTAAYFLLFPFHPFEAGDVIGYDFYGTHILPRILTSLATLPVYFSLILYPTHLHMLRYFPVFTSFLSAQVLAGTALAGAALAQIIWGRVKRGVPLSFGLFWFAAVLSPVTGIVMPVNALVFEHWMYMPTIGLFLGALQMSAESLDKLKIKQGIVPLLVLAAALLLGLKTFDQNKIWHDQDSFYGNIFDNGGRLDSVLENLGDYSLFQGEFDKAAEYFQGALANHTHSIPVALLHQKLALAYMHYRLDRDSIVDLRAAQAVLPQVTDMPKVISELEKSVELDHGQFLSYGLLSEIYKNKQDKAKAEFYHKEMERAQHDNTRQKLK